MEGFDPQNKGNSVALETARYFHQLLISRILSSLFLGAANHFPPIMWPPVKVSKKKALVRTIPKDHFDPDRCTRSGLGAHSIAEKRHDVADQSRPLGADERRQERPRRSRL